MRPEQPPVPDFGRFSVRVDGVQVGRVRQTSPVGRFPAEWQGCALLLNRNEHISKPFKTREEAVHWVLARHEELQIERTKNALFGDGLLHGGDKVHISSRGRRGDLDDHRHLTLCGVSAFDKDGIQRLALTTYIGESTCRSCRTRSELGRKRIGP